MTSTSTHNKNITTDAGLHEGFTADNDKCRKGRAISKVRLLKAEYINFSQTLFSIQVPLNKLECCGKVHLFQ